MHKKTCLHCEPLLKLRNCASRLFCLLGSSIRVSEAGLLLPLIGFSEPGGFHASGSGLILSSSSHLCPLKMQIYFDFSKWPGSDPLLSFGPLRFKFYSHLIHGLWDLHRFLTLIIFVQDVIYYLTCLLPRH